MKVTYGLTANPKVPLNGQLTPLQIDAVEVEWTVEGSQLTAAQILFRGLTIVPDPANGILEAHDPARDIVAFRVASYLADSIYSLTGVDALHPDQIGSQSPTIEPETDAERALLPQVVMGGSSGLLVTATVCRALNPIRLPGGQQNAVAIAHHARANRTADPFVQFEEFFKAVESVVPKGLDGVKLDMWVSGQAIGVDSTFTQQRVEQIRRLRNRITHPHANLGHLSPHELQHITEVRANLEDLRRMATILIWGTPMP